MGKIKKFKWCKRCDKWEEHLTRMSKACIKCIDESSRTRIRKKGCYNKALNIFCDKFGVNDYKEYLEKVNKQ